MKFLVASEDKPNILKQDNHCHAIGGLSDEVMANIFLKTIPKRFWQEKICNNSTKSPLATLMNDEFFKYIWESGHEGRPFIIHYIYRMMMEKRKHFHELTVDNDYPDIIEELDRGYINPTISVIPMGAQIPSSSSDKAAIRTQTLCATYKHLEGLLTEARVFEEVWQGIQIRQTPRFIPQFIQDMLPFLIESTPEGPFQAMFINHGIFKPFDIKQINTEWSRNYKDINRKIFPKFLKDFMKILSVVMSLGDHYWNPHRACFHGHIGRVQGTDKIRSCLSSYNDRIRHDEGVCLIRFSSKKGALAIDRVSKNNSKSFHLLVYIHLKQEKPYVWNSNAQQVYPFRSLRQLLEYISDHYVDISHIYTSDDKLLPVRNLEI